MEDTTIEYVLFSLFPIAGVLVARQGLKPWIKLEVFSIFLISMMCIFCPAAMIRPMSTLKVDTNHLYLFCFLGAVLVASVLYPLFLMHSEDKNIFQGYLWSRITFYAMVLMVHCHTYTFDKDWNYKILYRFGSHAFTCLLISGYFYIGECRPRNHSTFNDTINYYTKLECLKGLFYGLAFFGLPNLVLMGTGNESHRMLCQLIGACLVSMSFQAYGVSDFMYLKDKKTFILSRLISGVITLQSILVGFYYYKAVTQYRIVMVIASYSVYSAVLFVGYCSAKVKNE